MRFKIKKYFFLPFLFSLFLFSCKNNKNEKNYFVKLDSHCRFELRLPEELTQKTYIAKSDSSFQGDAVNIFKTKNDSSELKIIFNTIDSWGTEIKNYTDLKDNLIGEKMKEYIFSEVISSEFIKIDTLSFIKIKYGVLLLGTETVYGTIQNGKIINFEFISHQDETGYFVKASNDIMSNISCSCK